MNLSKYLMEHCGLQAQASEAEGTVEVIFTPMQYLPCKESDILIAVVYNESKNTYGFGTIERGVETNPRAMQIPVYFTQNDKLYVYLTACQPGSANGGTMSLAITAGA
jgi:hypothetical protein